MIDDVAAHESCGHAREKSVGDKREQVVPDEKWVWRLAKRGVASLCYLVETAVEVDALVLHGDGERARQEHARVSLLLWEEGGDE